ncbi:hypothetical protein L195_g058172 [Trifolium pratense]|uniref:Uncharacterized protein n=1 Tax=Trifolium pratense TaxID=57577 RepID=A0A2K3JQQ3_TRIPR|nr:hypothetical protein L195_g058172 [Trifolium pratense]
MRAEGSDYSPCYLPPCGAGAAPPPSTTSIGGAIFGRERM